MYTETILSVHVIQIGHHDEIERGPWRVRYEQDGGIVHMAVQSP